MTEIIKDDLKDVTMTIAGDDWLVAEAVVELSQADTPNYVDINKMVPATDTSIDGPPDSLIGEPFELRVENQLISQRDTDAEEETLLFSGNLANISATGQRSYEGIAYDPSQEGFNASQNSGSMMNQKIQLFWPYYGALYFGGLGGGGTTYEPRTRKASYIINQVMWKMGIDDYDIQLTENGVTREGPGGSVTGAYDRDVHFDANEVLVSKALNHTAEITESTYWFDKSGTFHFGVPDPTKHILHFIKDASDGMTTGPYQSVRVIGSGISSQEGWNRQSMVAEERIVKEYAAVRTSGSKFEGRPIDELDVGELPQPVFEYRNAELSTEAQAESAAKKIAKDIAKQQAKGKVTVVGFPEIEPLDAIKMPQAQDDSKDNYFPGQPMGGYAYSVYKVKHKLNSSDGFVTEVHVSGLVGAPGIVFEPEEPDSPESESTQHRRELLQEHGMGSGAALTR